jgi:hypothetical protein
LSHITALGLPDDRIPPQIDRLSRDDLLRISDCILGSD